MCAVIMDLLSGEKEWESAMEKGRLKLTDRSYEYRMFKRSNRIIYAFGIGSPTTAVVSKMISYAERRHPGFVFAAKQLRNQWGFYTIVGRKK